MNKRGDQMQTRVQTKMRHKGNDKEAGLAPSFLCFPYETSWIFICRLNPSPAAHFASHTHTHLTIKCLLYSGRRQYRILPGINSKRNYRLTEQDESGQLFLAKNHQNLLQGKVLYVASQGQKRKLYTKKEKMEWDSNWCFTEWRQHLRVWDTFKAIVQTSVEVLCWTWCILQTSSGKKKSCPFILPPLQ